MFQPGAELTKRSRSGRVEPTEETAVVCHLIDDAVPLSEVAGEYRCGHPKCRGCENSEECRKLNEQLSAS